MSYGGSPSIGIGPYQRLQDVEDLEYGLPEHGEPARHIGGGASTGGPGAGPGSDGGSGSGPYGGYPPPSGHRSASAASTARGKDRKKKIGRWAQGLGPRHRTSAAQRHSDASDCASCRAIHAQCNVPRFGRSVCAAASVPAAPSNPPACRALLYLFVPPGK
jgi:hypothetical protein